MSTITTLIVDDEPLARESLHIRLKREPDIVIVGEAIDGPAAVNAINTLEPNLVFLDVQLPGYDGFEVLRRVGPSHLPYVIFVTAFDNHAIKAFEIHALDYLLKPFTASRLHQALAHVRESIRTEETLAKQHEAVLGTVYSGQPSETPANRRALARIVVRHGSRHLVLGIEEIECVASAANYVEVHARGRTYLLRGTMHDFEERLPSRFVRIHRTHLVNCDYVREVVRGESGDFDVILRDGTRLKMSRKYRANLFEQVSQVPPGGRDLR